MPLRVLYISNESSVRCGVRAYGEQWVAACRRAGVSVTTFDGSYTHIKTIDNYLPTDALDYDVVHLNWDPQTINHYLPQHLAPIADRFSLFLHDVPPNSTCPVIDLARWVWSYEPLDGSVVLPHGIPPTPDALPPPDPPVVIGLTGIRRDPGIGQVQELCAARGWTVNQPAWWTDEGQPWLSTDDEIRRLARSTVNVCWYHTSGRGKSMAAMFCLAAQRPLVLSPSTMFSALHPYGEEIVIGATTDIQGLEACVQQALTQPYAIPRVQQDLAWDAIIHPVLTAWQETH
jgi:hypothetical protein